MKFSLIISIGIFLFYSSCKEETEHNFDRFHVMDNNPSVETLFNPKKKATIPFVYNQIYDPFLSPESIQKSGYLPGNVHSLKIHLVDTIFSSINVAGRKRKDKIVKAFPVIIKNTSETDTMYIPLHRGGAILIQEVKDESNNWKPIENQTKEKIGLFYYKIYPMEYIYTKTPIYKGKLTRLFRLKLALNDSTTIHSNEYKSTVQKWMLP